VTDSLYIANKLYEIINIIHILQYGLEGINGLGQNIPSLGLGQFNTVSEQCVHDADIVWLGVYSGLLQQQKQLKIS